MEETPYRKSVRQCDSVKFKIRERSSSIKRKELSPDPDSCSEKKYKHSQDKESVDTSYNYILSVPAEMNDSRIDNYVMSQSQGITSPPVPNHSYLIPPIPQHMMPPQGGCLTEIDIGRIVDRMKAAIKDEIESIVKMQVSTETEPLKREIVELRKEIEELRSKQQRQSQKQDDNEQYSRKKNIRIGNIKEEKGEDIAQLVVDIADKGNVKVSKTSIENCHRLGQERENKSRAVIVRFKSVEDKLEFVKCRKVLKEKDAKIYISDDLTKTRSDIAYAARQMKRNKSTNVKGTWVFNGCIYIETHMGDTVKINRLEELDKYNKRTI